MTDDIQARAAAIIHNESDLYLREAKKVAAALSEAGVLTNTDGRARLRLANDLTGALEALNAARAELATVREEWAKTENALYAAHDENINLKNRLLVRYRELDEANSRAHDAEVELARAEADRDRFKHLQSLAAQESQKNAGKYEEQWCENAVLQHRAEKAEAERESLRRQVAAVAKQARDAERRGAVAALREAADEVWGSDDTDDPDWTYVSNGDINLWLRNRADRIEGDLRGNDGLTDEERRGLLTSFHDGIGAKHVHSHVRAELEKVRAERDALLKEKRRALPTGPDEPYRTPEGVDEIPREW